MARLRTLLARAPRVLYALWLVVVMTQPAGAHACPVHDRALVDAMAAHGMSESMMQAVMHHAGHETPARGEHSDTRCHCLGDCCSGVATPLPSVATTIPAPASVLAGIPALTPVEHPFEVPARLLPPATAPPSALVA